MCNATKYNKFVQVLETGGNGRLTELFFSMVAIKNKL